MDRPLPKSAAIKSATYRFADLRLLADGTLLRGEIAIELPPLELALLRVLLIRQGETLRASDLSRALWGEPHHSHGDRLAQCLASLKKILHPTDCIESVSRGGFRIQAMQETGEDLSLRSRPCLAILPFTSGFEVADYIAPALTEQSTALLHSARLAITSIAARDSVHALVRRGLPRQEIGKMLGAEFVLAGQLTAMPGRHRLRLEMIRVEDDAPLWMEDLIAKRDGIAELAAQLAHCVSRRLGVEGLSHQIEAAAAIAPAAKSGGSEAERAARDLYLRAHHDWQSMERHKMQDAMGRLLRAIELDETLLAARVDLARIAVLQCIYGYLSPRIAAATVRRAAQDIPELNEQVTALLPTLAWVEFHFDRDARSARAMMARSEGSLHDAIHTRVRYWILLGRNRFGEAAELLRAALEADPWSPWLQTALAWNLHLAGEREASLAQATKILDLFPDYDNSLFFAAMILGYNGEAERAVEAAATLTERASHYDLATSARAYALACAGRHREARHLLDRLQWLSRERFVLNTLNAATHVALGDPDAALAELRTANETRCPWFFQTVGDPRLTPLRGHPEFAQFEAVLGAMENDTANAYETDAEPKW